MLPKNGRAAFLALAGPGASTDSNRVELQLEANEFQRLGQKLEQQIKSKDARIKTLEKRLEKLENLLNHLTPPTEGTQIK